MKPTLPAPRFLLALLWLALSPCAHAQGPALFRPGDLPTGLVGWWKLEEASDQRNDFSGRDNHLASNNNVGSLVEDYWVTGERSADFESSSQQYLSRAHGAQSGLDLHGDSFTLAGWVKCESFVENMAIMNKGDWAPTVGYLWRIDSAGRTDLVINGTSHYGPSGSFQVGKWAHLAVVRNLAASTIEFYVDGNLVSAVPSALAMSPTSKDFRLGQYNDVNVPFDGLMKDMAVWEVALTPLQIKSLALGVNLATQAFRPGNIPSGLVSWWKMDEISDGNSAVERRDSGPGGNDLAGTAGVEGGYATGSALRLNTQTLTRPAASLSPSIKFNSAEQGITVAAWLYFVSTAPSGGLFSLRSGNTFGVIFSPWGGNQVEAILGRGGSTLGMQTRTSGGALKTGTWQHVALVYDPVANFARIVIDGAVAETTADLGAYSGGIDTSNVDLFIGNYAGNFSNGRLSDLAVWNRALSAAELKALATGLPVQRAGIVSYWPLDGSDGVTGKWNDSIPRVNDIGGNDLTPSASAPASVVGKVGGAADFEADNGQSLSISDAMQNGLLLDRDSTLLLWFRAETGAGSQGKYLLDKFGDQDGYSVLQRTNGTLGTAVQSAELNTTSSLNVGAWQHMAMSLDGAKRRLFFNSAPEASSDSTVRPRATTQPFRLGARSPGDFFYDGLLDEVLVARRWFREEEIKTIYNKGLAGRSVFADGTGIPPQIDSLSAAVGKPGDQITIMGQGFSGNAGENIVWFGGVQAAVASASATSLVVVVPPGAVFAPVRVSVFGLSARSALYFTPISLVPTALSSGSFSAPRSLITRSSPSEAEVGDIDGDERLDFVVTSFTTDQFVVHRNNVTPGSLTENAPFPEDALTPANGLAFATARYPLDVALGDLDGDGRLDVVITNYHNGSGPSNKVRVHRNTSSGGTVSFDAGFDLDVGSAPTGVTIEDVDLDGRLDLLVANSGYNPPNPAGNTISILRNRFSGGLLNAQAFDAQVVLTAGPSDSQPTQIAVGDLDGDGKPEVVTPLARTPFVSVLRNITTPGEISTATFESAVLLASGAANLGTNLAVVADLNSDGRNDLAAINGQDYQLAIWRNTGAGNLSSRLVRNTPNIPFGSQPSSLAVGDLNGDGKPDLATRNFGAQSAVIFTNNSSPTAIALNAPFEIPALGMGNGMHIADFDTDGYNDLVGVNYEGSSLSLIRNLRNLPTVTSSPATAITFSSAMLHGTVNPNGSATTVYFEWGLTAAYGNTTPTQNLGAGASAVATSEALTGLQSLTMYHFRLVAQNVEGTSYGADQAFMTVAREPDVMTLEASDLDVNSAKLNGTVIPYDTPTDAVFEWGVPPLFDQTTPVQMLPGNGLPTPVAATLTGLSPVTTYHCRLRATNASGMTTGGTVVFTTASRPPLASTQPATNRTTTGTTTGATLHATVTPRDTETTVVFQWGTTPALGQVLAAGTLPASGSAQPSTAALGGQMPQTAIYYRVAATNAGGTTSGATEVFTTLPKLPDVRELRAENITATGARLEVKVTPQGAATTGYFEYGTTIPYDRATTVLDAGSGTAEITLSALISGLSVNNDYNYRFVATNEGGPTPSGNAQFRTVSGGNFAPAAVTGLATDLSTTAAKLRAAVNPNGGTTVAYFEYGTTAGYGQRVPPAPVPPAEESNIGNGTSTIFLEQDLPGLLPNTQYHFRIKAVNGIGTSEGEDQIFTTKALPPVVATQPATAIAFDRATLAGTVNPNGAPAAVYFESRPLSDGPWSRLAAPDPGTGNAAVPVSAQLSGLTADTAYEFRLVAQYDGDQTKAGAPEPFTTAPPPPDVATVAPTPIAATIATLRAQVHPRGLATTVYFDYGLTAYDHTTAVQDVVAGGASIPIATPIAGLTPNRRYLYRVTAANNSGSVVALGEFITPPLPPTVTAGIASNLGQTTVSLAATVNPQGAATRGRFRYGKTAAYELGETTERNYGTGEAVVPTTENLAGLDPNSVFHFAFVARNDGGETTGADRTFTTEPVLPPLVTLTTAIVNGTQATLQGTVDPQGFATAVHFEYGTTTALGNSTPAQNRSGRGAESVAALIIGLQPATTYHFRLVATNRLDVLNTGGASSTSIGQFTTPSAPLVTTGVATRNSSTRVTLTGTVNPFGLPTSSVFFEYGETAALGQTVVYQPVVEGGTPQPVSVEIAGLSANKTYHYRLVASTSAAQNVRGDVLTFDTGDSEAPVALPDTVFYPPTGTVFSPLLNDTDPNGDSLLIADEANAPRFTAGNGRLILSDDRKSITFSVESGFTKATAVYRAVDQHGAVSGEGMITLLHMSSYSKLYQTAAPVPVGPSLKFVLQLTVEDTGVVRGLFHLFRNNAGIGRTRFAGNLVPSGIVRGDFDILELSNTVRTNLELRLSPDHLDPAVLVAVTLQDGTTAPRAEFELRPATAVLPGDNGQYTAFIDPPEVEAAAASGTGNTFTFASSGFMTAKITKKGQARFVGRLPDTQPFSAGAQRPQGESYQIVSKLYRKGGRARGRLEGKAATLPLVSESAMSSTLRWEKEATPDTPYPQAFATELVIDGFSYTPPKQGELLPIGLGNSGAAIMRLMGGDLPSDEVYDINMRFESKKAVVGTYVPGSDQLLDPARMTLSFKPKTGLFRGSFFNPVTSKETKFKGAFQAALGIVPGEGRGSFSGQGQSGSVRIVPVLSP